MIVTLSACTGRGTLEETDANAPVTVEDNRTTVTSTETTVITGETSPLTGRKILSPASFTVKDPQNSKGLPTKRIEHSYGVAKNGKPHQISVDFQKYFVSTGYKAMCYDTSGKKVLYLTFDCGWENGYTDKCLDVLKEKNVPAAFFCTLDHIKSTPELIARMIKEDMLLKLDFENIPNFEYIDEQYKNAYYDPASEYSVPYFCGYVGIIYNTSMVDGEITDWDCLWDEANRGKILQFNNPRDAFGTALYYKGYDVNSYNKAEWEEAKELLKEQKPYVQSYVMDEVFNKMKNGSAAIAPYYVGDFLTMYEDNEDLAVVYPKSQTNIFVDAMCIPKVARNKELAEAYINFCLTEQISVANAEYVYYASPNVLVKDNEEYIEYMTDVHEDAIEILYPEGGINASYYQNLSPEMLAYMNSLWEELKIENSVGAWVYIFAGLIVGVLLLFGIANGIKKKINSKYY